MDQKPGNKYRIEFVPAGRRGYSDDNRTLLEVSVVLGLQISSLCGGKGTCRRCKIKIIDGLVSPPATLEETSLSAQELNDGFRLACQAYPLSDCRIDVPTESLSAPQRTQIEGEELTIDLDPPVHTYLLSTGDLKAFSSSSRPESPPDPDQPARVAPEESPWCQALQSRHNVVIDRVDGNGLGIDAETQPGQVSNLLVREGELIAVKRGPSARLVGLAVDLGTTKLAGYLLDLETGKTLTSQGAMNPQISYGEDVITRLAYACKSNDAARQLQEAVMGALNEMASALCQEVGAKVTDIVEAVVAGNTAMHHLMAGLPVNNLAVAPYRPAIKKSLHIKARELGLSLMPGAYVYLPPIVDGFVGSDHVAMMLATGIAAQGTEPDHLREAILAIDIGTNTEVSLRADGKISTVSCASGPAFEGAHIKDGMRAGPGAIERLNLSGNNISYQTIDGAAAAGLCGSGILDAVAQLLAAGVIDRSGRMSEHERVRTLDGRREFVIVEDAEGRASISITQGDIREIQLAKSAISMGIDTLLANRGYGGQDLDRVIIAGAFGSYIDVDSAIQIGMLPELPRRRFKQVGNAAGTGARMMTLSSRKRNEAETLASSIEYVELATDPSFAASFVKSTLLGQTTTRD